VSIFKTRHLHIAAPAFWHHRPTGLVNMTFCGSALESVGETLSISGFKQLTKAQREDLNVCPECVEAKKNFMRGNRAR
jgi:hypothetical protein